MPRTIATISMINRQARAEQVVFGDVVYQPGGTCGPRIQNDFQLVALHAGEAAITVDGEDFRLPVGHVALLHPGHRERFTFAKETRTHHTWCALHPDTVPATWREEIAAAPVSVPLTKRVETLLELGLSVSTSGGPTDALIHALGIALLREYLAVPGIGTGAVAGHTPALPEAVRRAKEIIEVRFQTPLDLATLARAACVTPNHLIRLFRAHLAITPARYLWQTRVRRGVEMLRETGLTVSEIAYQTGFQTPFHFSRLVKQQQQLSPKELRQRAWNPSLSGTDAQARKEDR